LLLQDFNIICSSKYMYSLSFYHSLAQLSTFKVVLKSHNSIFENNNTANGTYARGMFEFKCKVVIIASYMVLNEVQVHKL
jgi:hypothetical protein